jgi:hypothetical protein
MRILGLIIIIGLFYGCSSSVNEAETAYTSDLRELIPLKGHDPVEEGVFTDPYLKHRLIKLMGEDKYDTLVRAMYDCSPIGFNNDLLYWVGYGKNNPESTGGAIIIDLVNDEIYVGFEIGDKIRTYSEAGNVDKTPNKLKLWLNRREKMHSSLPAAEADSVDQVEQ